MALPAKRLPDIFDIFDIFSWYIWKKNPICWQGNCWLVALPAECLPDPKKYSNQPISIIHRPARSNIQLKIFSIVNKRVWFNSKFNLTVSHFKHDTPPGSIQYLITYHFSRRRFFSFLLLHIWSWKTMEWHLKEWVENLTTSRVLSYQSCWPCYFHIIGIALENKI